MLPLILPITLLTSGIVAFIATCVAGLPTLASAATILAIIAAIWGGLSIFNKIKVCIELVKGINTLVADIHKKLDK